MDAIPTTPSSSPEQEEKRPAVEWRDLREWMSLIEKHEELLRVRPEIDPHEELGAFTFMATRDGKSPAFLFENLKGNQTDARILSNYLGSSKERYALAVGLDPSMSIQKMIEATRPIMKRRLPPKYIPKAQAKVNEIVLRGDEIDLTRLPIPKFWPGDGGQYIGTGDIVFTRDPESGRINVGAYRHMLHGKNRIGMYNSPGKHGRLDREAWWARGEPCEVVAAYGIDPVMLMVAGQTMSFKESELDAAGGIMGCPVELTEAETVSLPIPAHAEIVIEGVMRPGNLELEGPLGEFTGYYGNERGMQPVIDVTAVHMRRSPIITAALMASYPSCEIGTHYAIMRSARVLDDLDKIGVPGVQAAYCHPAAASGWGMLVVSMTQQYPGHAAQVMALAAQCPGAAYYTKWIIVVDDDVDPTDFNQVMWAMTTRCHPSDDIEILRNTWSTWLDPSQGEFDKRPFGSKALINACKPYRYLKEFAKESRINRSMYDSLANRWPEFGLTSPVPNILKFHGD
jgi:UbiD family decarboxylase